MKMRLLGLVNPRDELPAFLIPIFGGGEGFWLQDVDDAGRVVKFCRCDFNGDGLQAVEPRQVETGEFPLYAFGFAVGDVIVGSRDELFAVLRRRYDQLRPHPFVQLEVSEFLSDSELKRVAALNAGALLATEDPEISRRWFESQRVQAPLQQDVSSLGEGVRIIHRQHPELGFGVIKYREEDAFGDARYQVSFDHSDRLEVLAPANVIVAGRPLDDLRENRLGDVAVFRRKVAAGAVLSENNRSGAFLKVSTQPLPHQVFLWDKLLSSNRFGHILADDVGMGKTIEAGLLLTTLLQERANQRVLIVCPKGLATQWQDELEEHFGLFFAVMGEEFKGKLASAWRNNRFAIAPIDRIKRPDYADALRQAAPFDIIICDEAHKLTARRDLLSSKLEKTANYQLFERLISERLVTFVPGNDGAPRSPRILLLSATPHQGDDERFVHLLHLARPDLFAVGADAALPATLLQPETLVETITRTPKSCAVYWDNRPIFKGHDVRTLTVDWTPEEDEVSTLLTNYIQESLAAASGKSALIVQLVMHTFHKIAASSWEALEFTMRNRLEALRGEKSPLIPETDEDDERELPENLGEAPTQPFFGREETLLRELISRIRKLNSDSKWEKCATLVRDIDVAQPGAKFLFFTQYRATQSYITRRLRELFPDVGVELIHGDIDATGRKAARLNFEAGSRFLISTEAGGEGINLQKACHLMVNYDLPWNPMRLQQRIGRLDRFGQKNRVQVFNLLVPASWDHHISLRITERLESIQASMSAVTADVEDYKEMLLGAIADQINATELFAQASARGGREVPDTAVDQWVSHAFKSMDRWKQVFSRDLGMSGEITTFAPKLTSEDFRTAFSFAAGQHDIRLMETRTSESKFVEGVYHFPRPPAFRGMLRASKEVYVVFNRARFAEVRNEPLGKVRGQEIKPSLAAFGDELTDWLFEKAFAALPRESAYAISAGKKWAHGCGVLLVYALRWLAKSRRLRAPDSLVGVFQSAQEGTRVIAQRELMDLAADCHEIEISTAALAIDEAQARKLAQEELRQLVAKKDESTRGAAGISLLLVASVS